MAMTACSAKVCSNATWLSEKPPISALVIATAPIAAPSRSSGNDICDLAPRLRTAALTSGAVAMSRT